MPKHSTSARTTALNGICPYFTMFPLPFPMDILRRHSSPGEVALDPFCGRGTTNYAARLCGLASFGVDAAPVAAAVAQAKLSNTSPWEVMTAAQEILRQVPEPSEVPAGEFWDWAFHPEVLKTICRLREGLLRGCESGSRQALRALMLGALHGPIPKGCPSYFSNQCQRTYSPKPAYAVRFWAKRGIGPPRVNVLAVIAKRAIRYFGNEKSQGCGRVLLGDSRYGATLHRLMGDRRASWVITSPPYYGLRTYVPDHWLRHWFLGGPARVDYSAAGQVSHSSPREYVEQLRQTWRNVAEKCDAGAHLIVRFGSINDRRRDCLTLAKASLADSGWEIGSIQNAGTAAKGRRQALHFAASATTALTEFDIWATLLTK